MSRNRSEVVVFVSDAYLELSAWNAVLACISPYGMAMRSRG